MTILIPVQLQRAMQELPPPPPFEEFLPIPPPPSPEPVNLIRGAIAIIVLMAGVGFISNFIPAFVGVLILLIGLGAIIWQMQMQYVTYKSRLRDHGALTENYFLLLTNYSRKQSEHEQKIALSRTGDRLKAYRQSKILEILNKTNAQIAQKALKSDDIFEYVEDERSLFSKKLKQALSKNLYQGITIHIPGFNYTFAPKFTYINPDSHLHIAITPETDQILPELQTFCQDYLLKAGWIVINFTSVDLTQQPDRCIQEITNLIAELS